MTNTLPLLMVVLAMFGLGPPLAVAANENAPSLPTTTATTKPSLTDPFEIKLAEVQRSHAYLRSLTTLDLIGETEVDLQRRIAIRPNSYPDDDRKWYSEGRWVLRHGDLIVDRFHVLTVIDGKITKHELIDRVTGVVCVFKK